MKDNLSPFSFQRALYMLSTGSPGLEGTCNSRSVHILFLFFFLVLLCRWGGNESQGLWQDPWCQNGSPHRWVHNHDSILNSKYFLLTCLNITVQLSAHVHVQHKDTLIFFSDFLENSLREQKITTYVLQPKYVLWFVCEARRLLLCDHGFHLYVVSLASWLIPI